MYLPLPPSLSRPRRRRALPSSIHSESTIDLKTSAAPVAFCAGMQSLCMSPRTSARTARTIHEAAATPRERLGWLAGQERPRNQTFSKQVTCETFLLSREGETRMWRSRYTIIPHNVMQHSYALVHLEAVPRHTAIQPATRPLQEMPLSVCASEARSPFGGPSTLCEAGIHYCYADKGFCTAFTPAHPVSASERGRTNTEENNAYSTTHTVVCCRDVMPSRRGVISSPFHALIFIFPNGAFGQWRDGRLRVSSLPHSLKHRRRHSAVSFLITMQMRKVKQCRSLFNKSSLYALRPPPLHFSSPFHVNIRLVSYAAIRSRSALEPHLSLKPDTRTIGGRGLIEAKQHSRSVRGSLSTSSYSAERTGRASQEGPARPSGDAAPTPIIRLAVTSPANPSNRILGQMSSRRPHACLFLAKASHMQP
ncbi:hypothetical protein C7M84_014224 [Penaeus vannamei]|uniref:Uncharacterized protein n=1 Tax=Penaeus vannamei TaxID=6689 RepID=A0A423SU09_PENVA|nr:hypothetical protein C7M84_014224 [Penaeus vannamei]